MANGPGIGVQSGLWMVQQRSLSGPISHPGVLLSNSASPLGAGFHSGKKYTFTEGSTDLAVFGTQNFGLLGSRLPPPLKENSGHPFAVI